MAHVGPIEYVQLVCLWLGTLGLVAVAALIRQRCLEGRPLPVWPGARPWLHAALRVKKLLSHPLRPRDFWAAACGGMSLGDLLLVLLWLTVVLSMLGNRVWGKLGVCWLGIRPWPNAQAVQIRIGQYLGTVIRPQLLFLLYPVERSSLIAWLFGTYYSAVIKYHRWMGWSTVVFIASHSFMYSFPWISRGTWLRDAVYHQTNFAGVVATSTALLIAATSTAWFRRWWYQAFWLIHVCSAPLFFLAAVAHDHPLAYRSLPGVLLYFLDRSFRCWQHQHNSTHVSVDNGGLAVVGNIITLRTLWVQEDPGIRVGQTLYLSCPSLSLVRSHPFSIAHVQPASVQQQESPAAKLAVVTLFVRVSGDWTRLLKQHAIERPWCPLEIQVEGPYNTEISDASLDWTQQTCLTSRLGDATAPGMQCPETLVLVAGGIGVTPLLGLLKGLISRAQREGKGATQAPKSGLPISKPAAVGAVPKHSEGGGGDAMPQVYLIYTCRHLDELQVLEAEVLDEACREGSWLHVHIAYTGFEPEKQGASHVGPGLSGHLVSSPGLVPSFPQGPSPRLLYPPLGHSPYLYVLHAGSTYGGAALMGLLLPVFVFMFFTNVLHVETFRGSLVRSIFSAVTMGLGAICVPLLLQHILEGKRRSGTRAQPARGSCCQWWWQWALEKCGAVQSSTHTCSYKLADGQDLSEDPCVDAETQPALTAGTQQPEHPQTQEVHVLPGYILAWGNDGQNRLAMHRGRPDLRSLLHCVYEHHSSGGQQKTHVGSAAAVGLNGQAASDVEMGILRASPQLAQKGAPQFTNLTGFESVLQPKARGEEGTSRGARMVVCVGGPEPMLRSAFDVCDELGKRGRIEVQVMQVTHIH